MDPPMDHSIEPKFTKLSKLSKNEVMQENKYCCKKTNIVFQLATKSKNC